ncbi:hypothetical protein [Streptomyces cylindrosporus]|uniref:Uncharacterized protein n=1 Tax=Streptomyces cylindrosporus TaxID=2927583 RepID=A0ABS9YJI4_9ACTN|nr:hypothetical protein [Streptomyces cylindrosporus]MCI3277383.1 hypothetical protein [Streptomyces cylindrosporus]
MATHVTVDEHVRVRLPAPAWLAQLADVLIEHGTGADRARETAATHPGALVVAVHHRDRCWLSCGAGGTVIELRGPACDDTWAALASLAHAWLVAGLPAEEFAHPSSSRSRRRADSASSDPERPAVV